MKYLLCTTYKDKIFYLYFSLLIKNFIGDMYPNHEPPPPQLLYRGQKRKRCQGMHIIFHILSKKVNVL